MRTKDQAEALLYDICEALNQDDFSVTIPDMFRLVTGPISDELVVEVLNGLIEEVRQKIVDFALAGVDAEDLLRMPIPLAFCFGLRVGHRFGLADANDLPRL